MLNRFLSQIQDDTAFLRPPATSFMLGLKEPSLVTISWQVSTTFALSPSCSPATSHPHTQKKHPHTYILLILFVYCFSILYCSHFSLSPFHSERLPNFQYISYYLCELLPKFQSQIFNSLLTMWLLTMWQAVGWGWWSSNSKPAKSSQSRADHLHLNSKCPNPRLSLYFFQMPPS